MGDKSLLEKFSYPSQLPKYLKYRVPSTPISDAATIEGSNPIKQRSGEFMEANPPPIHKNQTLEKLKICMLTVSNN
jgi:hypothetical protein